MYVLSASKRPLALKAPSGLEPMEKPPAAAAAGGRQVTPGPYVTRSPST